MSCIYFLLVWLDLRTASTVTKLIDKTPQKSLWNNLLVLDSSVDRRTDRIKRNLGKQSVGD
jgi:hypothetical protein